ncbi:hypothetical protein [Flavobacterium aquiphilum]|uniref:hypothetical protein n=1 Tax=Flavobacterium aquiphilum TaxID=3003261 RepID=UPI002480FDC8|nr:hypothetical protein [Flavobacterium aquiphilum]
MPRRKGKPALGSFKKASFGYLYTLYYICIDFFLMKYHYPSPDSSEKPTVNMAYILCRGKATNGSYCKYIKMLPEERGLATNSRK